MQKMALSNLSSIGAIFTTTVLTTLICVKFLGFTHPLEFGVILFTVMANIDLIVAAVRIRRVFCMQSDPKKIQFDERDRLINYASGGNDAGK
jgi:hypothetical protein